MGPRNGAIAFHEAQKLSKGPLLYLTTTHYIPKRCVKRDFPRVPYSCGGCTAEGDRRAWHAVCGTFRQSLGAIEGTAYRRRVPGADITFGKEITLDLGGGVTARFSWLGAAHTQGDELIDVEPDNALISGDLVQNKLVPCLGVKGV